jgi:hypothetical protein
VFVTRPFDVAADWRFETRDIVSCYTSVPSTCRLDVKGTKELNMKGKVGSETQEQSCNSYLEMHNVPSKDPALYTGLLC